MTGFAFSFMIFIAEGVYAHRKWHAPLRGGYVHQRPITPGAWGITQRYG